MALLSRKLRNRLNKKAEEKWTSNPLVIDVKNIRVNGQSVGCSGFIGNLYTNNIVYVNTETNSNTKYLFRHAESMWDYTGGANRYAFNIDEYVDKIIAML